MVDPKPVLIVLGAIAAIMALFVSAASYDVYGALLWYQSPRIWVFVSAVSVYQGLLILPYLFITIFLYRNFLTYHYCL